MYVLNPANKKRVARAIASRSARRSGGWRIKRSSKSGRFSSLGKTIGQAVNPSTSKALSGLKPSSFFGVLPVAGGFYANTIVANKLAEKIGWTEGWKNTALGFGTAGLFLFVPKFGQKMFEGAMTQATVKMLLPYIQSFTEPAPAPRIQQPIQQISSTAPASLPAPAAVEAAAAQQGGTAYVGEPEEFEEE